MKTMSVITRKGDLKTEWEICKQTFDAKNLAPFIQSIHERILLRKVKFPLLEYCAEEIYTLLPDSLHIPFCDAIESLKTEGGNVLLGKILQLRLDAHFQRSLEKATEYISKADIWYVCDIIGERVFGFALLRTPKKMLPAFKKISKHPSNWVVRSLGAGAHYAIKKGLEEKEVERVFEMLLTMANTNDKEIRQGIGWAAKTTAKFHPELIASFQTEIQNKDKVANWFRAKIEIGLNRNAHAKGS